jgi:hypothetical protein
LFKNEHSERAAAAAARRRGCGCAVNENENEEKFQKRKVSKSANLRLRRVVVSLHESKLLVAAPAERQKLKLLICTKHYES